MKQVTISILMFCATLMSSITVSAQKAYWASSDDSLAKKIIAMEKMWAESDCNPQPELKEMFADEFQGTWIDGNRYGKDEAISTPKDRYRQCQLGDVKIQFFGETVAIAYGSESSILKSAGGKENKRCLVWTDTWLKRDGKWQIIAAQDNVVECPK